MVTKNGQSPSAKTEADYLYNKAVLCPACNSKVIVRAVRTSSLRLVSRDTDSRPVYKDINPLFYDVWLCNGCGYANLQSHFAGPLSKAAVAQIQKNVTSRWQAREYPEIYSVEIAIERFKLALFNAMMREANPSEIAMLCLKTAWLYREKQDLVNESRYLEQACKGFEKAFVCEDPPVFGMDAPTHMYLIGELYRRLGEYPKALKWFGEVLASPLAKKSLKDKTRDQKDLTLEAMNVAGASVEIS